MILVVLSNLDEKIATEIDNLVEINTMFFEKNK